MREPRINYLFVQAMNSELRKNIHKGDWYEWKQSPEDWLLAIQSRLDKLSIAINEDSKEDIKKYSVDVANLAERSFITFGEAGERD